MENLKTYYRNGTIGVFKEIKEAKPKVNSNVGLIGSNVGLKPKGRIQRMKCRVEVMENASWRHIDHDEKRFHKTDTQYDANQFLTLLQLRYPHKTFRVVNYWSWH